jgi:hypothetical protein
MKHIYRAIPKNPVKWRDIPAFIGESRCSYRFEKPAFRSFRKMDVFMDMDVKVFHAA